MSCSQPGAVARAASASIERKQLRLGFAAVTRATSAGCMALTRCRGQRFTSLKKLLLPRMALSPDEAQATAARHPFRILEAAGTAHGSDASAPLPEATACVLGTSAPPPRPEQASHEHQARRLHPGGSGSARRGVSACCVAVRRAHPGIRCLLVRGGARRARSSASMLSCCGVLTGPTDDAGGFSCRCRSDTRLSPGRLSRRGARGSERPGYPDP